MLTRNQVIGSEARNLLRLGHIEVPPEDYDEFPRGSALNIGINAYMRAVRIRGLNNRLYNLATNYISNGFVRKEGAKLKPFIPEDDAGMGGPFNNDTDLLSSQQQKTAVLKEMQKFITAVENYEKTLRPGGRLYGQAEGRFNELASRNPGELIPARLLINAQIRPAFYEILIPLMQYGRARRRQRR